jgi:AAHS family benzoate transporter-like MFS transporter
MFAMVERNVWLAQIAVVMVIYGLGTWLPQIMHRLGYNLASSLSFLAVFMLASAFGGILLGRLADRFGTLRTLTTAYVFGALAICGLAFGGPLLVTYVLVACAGFGSIGVAMVQLAYITSFYPARLRAGATGWAVRMGRFGAMLGPLTGEYLAAQGISARSNFYVFGAIGIFAAMALVLAPRRRHVVDADDSFESLSVHAGPTSDTEFSSPGTTSS